MIKVGVSWALDKRRISVGHDDVIFPLRNGISRTLIMTEYKE